MVNSDENGLKAMKSTANLQGEFRDLCDFILGGTDKQNYEARIRAIQRLSTVINLLAEHDQLTPAMLARGQKAIAAVH